jgi:hypothetical protein
VTLAGDDERAIDVVDDGVFRWWRNGWNGVSLWALALVVRVYGVV